MGSLREPPSSSSTARSGSGGGTTTHVRQLEQALREFLEWFEENDGKAADR